MSKKAIEAEWRSRFAAHTTRTAFNLTLSRRMVQMLHIARDCDNQLALPWLMNGACMCLLKRGLIRFELGGTPDDASKNRYRLTEAGIKTVELLVLAGLIPRSRTLPVFDGA